MVVADADDNRSRAESRMIVVDEEDICSIVDQRRHTEAASRRVDRNHSISIIVVEGLFEFDFTEEALELLRVSVERDGGLDVLQSKLTSWVVRAKGVKQSWMSWWPTAT